MLHGKCGSVRLADYVIEFLNMNNVKDVFMLSGGGMMYLMDALGHSRINYVCCHHEQAAGIAAQAYAMTNNELGVCMVTTGPGGTNALTACGAAYVDSTPVMFITGQVKRADFASLRGVRQFGAQENDIVSMATPVTKYAVTIMKPEEIRYHLEKAIFLAMNGRRGPVWIDIPLDIQNSEVDPGELRGFSEEEVADKDIYVAMNPNMKVIGKFVESFLDDLRNSKRPLILVGHGVKASKAEELLKKIIGDLRIPVEVTWRELDLLDETDSYFFGSPGLQARRYSNIIIQGCDLLLVLGSRLDNMITAFDEWHFGFRAKKYIVDIDENEISKLNMQNVVSLNSDVKYFLEILSEKMSNYVATDYQDWMRFCSNLKKRFPIGLEKQERETDLVDLYQMTDAVSSYCKPSDTIVISSTSRCNTAGHIAFRHKSNQRTVSSMGFGSMGFALPSVVGAWFASGKHRIIMLEGDGSLQLNIQELQTIVHHRINAKMFVFSNVGYAAISTMQDRNFDGFHVGSDADSGVTMPNLSALSSAYGIEYYRIDKNRDIAEVLEKVMGSDGPVICEFVGSILFDEIPKCISSLNENGERVSAALENPFPFLSEKDMEDIYHGF